MEMQDQKQIRRKAKKIRKQALHMQKVLNDIAARRQNEDSSDEDDDMDDFMFQ